MYATVADIQARMTRTLSGDEQTVCMSLLEDVAVLIDAYAPNADSYVKKVVSCRVIIRALGNGGDCTVPVGATQGSLSALGYSQSWTMGSGSTGELYLSREEKRLLGRGNSIGSYSPVEALAEVVE